MNINVILAIFWRNLAAYFSSPIGYVFICAFVLLSAIAAFWPNEFFIANLANLNQLNRALPWIMLVIVPAITMSIWADERRQGTDELLLTLPASDLDVVVGKYAASLAIFTIALVFSLCNVAVLAQLGKPDGGLLAANYIGYWIVGAGMLAVGMAASFLSSNLTVSFILAVAMNAPLAFASSADVILPRDVAGPLRTISIQEQFEDFGRGVIAMQSIVFFASLAVVMLYLCMVLIGRRHWGGRRQGLPMAVHYTLRLLALLTIAVGVNTAAARFGGHLDVSSERLSSLHPASVAMLEGLPPDRPVVIEAYISPEVPEEYVQTRLNLLNVLREVDARGGDRVIVRVSDTERYSAEASEAESQFQITAQTVQSEQQGALSLQEIHLGAAFLCGLEKVVVPFFDKGIPAEYEVIRSIATVSQEKRKKIGVVTTDVKLFGGFDMQSFSQRPDQRLVEELRKQYEVISVDPATPISDEFDALLVAQPTSLPQEPLDHVADAIRRGVPTAIFEDPFPWDSTVPASSQPRGPQANPFQQREMPEPKGDATALWALLGVRYPADTILWQDYNPFPRFDGFHEEVLFIDVGLPGAEAFNEAHPVTSGLQQLAFIFAGEISPAAGASTTFTPLVRTSTRSATVNYNDLVTRTMFGSLALNPERRPVRADTSFVLAALIEGAPGAAASAPEPSPAPATAPEPSPSTAPGNAAPASRPIRTIMVTDIDLFYPQFFDLRQRGEDATGAGFNFDNVTLVLNILDSLTGDDRFLDIRKRRPAHRTLTAVEQRTEAARDAAEEERDRYLNEFKLRQEEEQKKLDDRIAALRARTDIDQRRMAVEIDTAQSQGQTALDNLILKLAADRDRAMEQTETELALEIARVQHRYKLLAVLLPPIPPLALAIAVYLRRRRLEQLGVPKGRLRGA